jgi:UDPglucose 6-dehydrogenase
LYKSLKHADLILICIPTDLDKTSNSNNLTTLPIEKIVQKAINTNHNIPFVIKSTIPIGFTDYLYVKYNIDVTFSPEFLREGNSYNDISSPSRIIIGSNSAKSTEIANMFTGVSESRNTPVLYMSPTEAESVKLFSNAYLALRISFFNELDSFAEINNLNSEMIIRGMCLDKRIGNFYNNPSFGFGGYCLPKDSKQLVNHLNNLPNSLISAIQTSNKERKNFIVNRILASKANCVGIYRLFAKTENEDIRHASILEIIETLEQNGINIIIYEPKLSSANVHFEQINDLNYFKQKSDIIVANRTDKRIEDVSYKVYTRDIFHRN